jgi:hypothetical protein
MQLKKKDDDEIIRIKPTQVSYVDEHFWHSKFKEKKDEEITFDPFKNSIEN